MNTFGEVIMTKEKTFIHPYIPNSVPEINEEILKEIGGRKNTSENFHTCPLIYQSTTREETCQAVKPINPRYRPPGLCKAN